MSNNEYIYAKDLPLHVDVHCYGCGKLCALSNVIQRDGRYYCGPCDGQFVRGTAVAEFLTDWPESAVIKL